MQAHLEVGDALPLLDGGVVGQHCRLPGALEHVLYLAAGLDLVAEHYRAERLLRGNASSLRCTVGPRQHCHVEAIIEYCILDSAARFLPSFQPFQAHT